MKIAGAILACMALAGCADINDIRAEPTDLSVTVHAQNISKFTDCLHDELLTTTGSAFVVVQSVDRNGIAHIDAHAAGSAGQAVYVYDVTVSPGSTLGDVVVERHSKKNMWGNSEGPRNLKEIADICAR
jgi:hypothetical protein